MIKIAVKQLKKGVLANKLKDFSFNLNYNAYNKFLNDFLKGKVSMDPDLLLVQALAEHLFRPIVIISTLPRHDSNKILKFNSNS